MIDNNNKDKLPRSKITFRLLYQDEIALGPGKAQLLEAIVKTGSISAAGKSMNMSYRRAWMLVDVMNRSFVKPLVQTAKGGQHGGGAVLTPLGHEVLASYKQVSDAIQHTVAAYLPLFSGLLVSEQANDASSAKINDHQDDANLEES